MTAFGTFWTWRDVRLESVNRLKADMINAEKFQKWFELPKADLAALAAKEGEMTLLTSAECREIADRKMMEAAGDRLQGKEFRATAEAWLVLAEKIEQAEAIEALKMKGK